MFGSIFIMNLFLAMLIRNFNNHETAEFDFRATPVLSPEETILNFAIPTIFQPEDNEDDDDQDLSEDYDTKTNKYGANSVSIKIENDLLIVKVKEEGSLYTKYMSTFKKKMKN